MNRSKGGKKYDGGPYKIMCRPGSYLLIREVEALDDDYNPFLATGTCPDLTNTVMSECSGRQQCILFLSKLGISTATCPKIVYIKITTGCISIKEMAIRGFAPRRNKVYTGYFQRHKKNLSQNLKINLNSRIQKKKIIEYWQTGFDKLRYTVVLQMIEDIQKELKFRKILKLRKYLSYINKLEKKREDSICIENVPYKINKFKKPFSDKIETKLSTLPSKMNFDIRTLTCEADNCSLNLISIDKIKLENIYLIAKIKLLNKYKIMNSNNSLGAPSCHDLKSLTKINNQQRLGICSIEKYDENVHLMIKENLFVFFNDSKNFLIQLNNINQLHRNFENIKRSDIDENESKNSTKEVTLVAEKRMKVTCKSDFCSNNGFCFLTTMGYKMCICRLGFGGIKCETKHDACSSQPCLHGGICYKLANQKFRCNCPPKYDGLYCHRAIQTCDRVQCFNGGVCRSSKLLTGFTCLCPSGYGGLQCELVDPCLNLPCKNGAMCRLNSNTSTFTCICPAGFSGITCNILKPKSFDLTERNNDACSEVPCQNNAVCQPTSMAPGFICICANGVKGKLCEFDHKNECLSHPCRNNGVCLNLPGNFKCKCPIGYSGVTCETKEFNDLCDSKPCKNEGKCRVINKTSYECFCHALFSGANCDIQLNPCNSSTSCPPNKKCIEMRSSFLNPYLCVDTSTEPIKKFHWFFIDSKNKSEQKNKTSYVEYRHTEPFTILAISILILISIIVLISCFFLVQLIWKKDINLNNQNNNKSTGKIKKDKNNSKNANSAISDEEKSFNQGELKCLLSVNPIKKTSKLRKLSRQRNVNNNAIVPQLSQCNTNDSNIVPKCNSFSNDLNIENAIESKDESYHIFNSPAFCLSNEQNTNYNNHMAVNNNFDENMNEFINLNKNYQNFFDSELEDLKVFGYSESNPLNNASNKHYEVSNTNINKFWNNYSEAFLGIVQPKTVYKLSVD